MENISRLRLQAQENQKTLDEKATNFDSREDHEYYEQNSLPREETDTLESEGTPTKTEAEPSTTDTGTISNTSSEPLDISSSIFSNCDLDDDTTPEDDSCKDKESKKKKDGEEEGTYEELICLVRQFYVEKPINPAALAHQNIETC